MCGGKLSLSGISVFQVAESSPGVYYCGLIRVLLCIYCIYYIYRNYSSSISSLLCLHSTTRTSHCGHHCFRILRILTGPNVENFVWMKPCWRFSPISWHHSAVSRENGRTIRYLGPQYLLAFQDADQSPRYRSTSIDQPSI